MRKYLKDYCKAIPAACCLLITLLPNMANSQEMTSSEIQLGLKKLNVLASVMYLAAHPDDENTRMISYMSNHVMARTCYLSLTRGDGGQNLIGSEKGASMGVLRTNELLQARKIDGGEQLFTRAVDFGYSKNPKETFTKWTMEDILSDVVWAIREFKPDIIITRFSMEYKKGHGHHSASAILADLAFDQVGNEKFFPEQLEHTELWQPTRMFFNASTWWDKELKETAKNDKNYTSINSGIYNPLLGASYADIASESRSQHKSQGFGDSKERGESIEYLHLIKGDAMDGDVFDGIDITWNRVAGGAEIGKVIESAIKKFNPEDPTTIVNDLIKAHQLLDGLKDEYWKKVKQAELKRLILACSGIYLELNADDYSEAVGVEIGVTSSVVCRLKINAELKGIKLGNIDTVVNSNLEHNIMYEIRNKVIVPANPNTQPYWLLGDFEGMYEVNDRTKIGPPLSEPTLTAVYTIEINGAVLTFNVPLKYWWNDLVEGEMYRPFVSMPKVTANLDNNVFVFNSGETKQIAVNLKSHTSNTKGYVTLKVGDNWTVTTPSLAYNIKKKGGEQQVVFEVTSPAESSVAEVSVSFEEPARSFNPITYAHIETQVLLPLAKSKLVSLDIKTVGKKVGYIVGSGDDVPASIEQLGYEVVILDENAIRNSDLSEFDAIVAGVRLYNTHKYIVHVNKKLMEYVKNGGNYIVQYNTTYNLLTKDIGPYPFKISRDRVTVEEAKPIMLAPKHDLVNVPNKIEMSDFNGWVQERGLYFPGTWDDKYTPLIAWNDPGDKLTEGSLLVTSYGKGTFIYTGISFFRELPAGVPGAYKLLANMLSYRDKSNVK
ncbi:MAG: PIG-L family deacetylase [Flavobacteriales bacterium]|nr:PIG-L family deacetylase [Flavobacteriales bacterium]